MNFLQFMGYKDKDTSRTIGSKSDVKRLLNSLSECLDVNGVGGTIRILERKDVDAINDKVDKHKIMLSLQKQICQAFKIDNIDELFGVTRGYPRKYAFAAWCHILSRTCEYRLEDMSEFSSKIISTVSKAIKFYASLDDSSKLKRDVKSLSEPIRVELKNQYKRN